MTRQLKSKQSTKRLARKVVRANEIKNGKGRKPGQGESNSYHNGASWSAKRASTSCHGSPHSLSRSRTIGLPTVPLPSPRVLWRQVARHQSNSRRPEGRSAPLTPAAGVVTPRERERLWMWWTVCRCVCVREKLRI